MAATVPLIAQYQPDHILLQQGTQRIEHACFLADVLALAARLPELPHALNLCEDRYAFTVAFAAVLVRGQANLLASTPLPSAAAAIRARYPHSYILRDSELSSDALEVAVPPTPGAARSTQAPPQIAADLTAAIVFTSGSTGEPQPHDKTWGSMCYAAQAIARRLLSGLGAEHVNLLATVPSQHMYGLETSTLQALAAGHCAATARPVFPGDVRAALAQLPAPRVLVTTPVHLRALLAAGVPMGSVVRVISATAPLSPELAAQVQARLGTRVSEIYGCTEAGSIATRDTTAGENWHPLDGLRVVPGAAVSTVEGGQLPQAVPLPDIIELAPSGDGFRLLCRPTDLLKVAGKRASAIDLTQKLLSIPGVHDGVIFQPARDALVERTAALVVAPDLSEAQILAALSERMDAVFLPRPLRKVAQLPRNATGKLPLAQLLRLLDPAAP